MSDTNLIVENKPFLSDNMKKLSVLLNKYIEQDMGKYLNSHQFQPINQEFTALAGPLRDRFEILMVLFLSVTRFNSRQVFTSLLSRNNNFKDLQPDWY